MNLLLITAALAGDAAFVANAAVPKSYQSDLKFGVQKVLDGTISAVVPTTWVKQSIPDGSYAAPPDSPVSPKSTFRIGKECGPGCKAVEDWAPVLEGGLFKPLLAWSWTVERKETSPTLRFWTARSPSGVVEIVRALYKEGGTEARYCHAHLVPAGSSVGRDPIVDKFIPAFEAACLALK